MYALATVFRRGADGTEVRGPARAVGALPFTVGRDSRSLVVSLKNVPNKIIPIAGLEFRLSAYEQGGKPFSGRAFAALYVVDEGLLNLTQQPVPAPGEHFLGQRRLGLEIFDSYNRLLLTRYDDGRSGNDAALYVSRLLFTGYSAKRLLAEAERPREVMFKDGLSDVISLGTRFRDFTGTVRVVVLLWTESRIGVDHKDVLVRDSIVAVLPLPQFIAPGDSLSVPLSLTNYEALDGDYRLQIEGAHVKAPGSEGEPEITIQLAPHKKKIVPLNLDVPAGEVKSLASVNATLKGQDGNPIDMDWKFTYNMRHTVAPETKYAAELRLESGKSIDIDAALIPDALNSSYRDFELQARFTKEEALVTSLPGSAEEGLSALDGFIWRATLALQQPEGKNLASLESLLDKIVALQRQSGAFAAYRTMPVTVDEEGPSSDRAYLPREDELWTTAFAVDLLRLAAKAGYGQSAAYASGLEFLKSELGAELQRASPETAEDAKMLATFGARAQPAEEAQATTEGGQEAEPTEAAPLGLVVDNACRGKSYAAFVLAAHGEISPRLLGAIQRSCAADSDATEIDPIVNVLLAAARREAGDSIEDVKLSLVSFDVESVMTSNGKIRDSDAAAIVLAFLSRAGIRSEQSDQLTRHLREATKSGMPLSMATQAWLARQSLDVPSSDAAQGSAISVVLSQSADASALDELILARNREGISTRFLARDELSKWKLSARNDGSTPVKLTVFVRGLPRKQTAFEETDRLLRSFYDSDGKPISSDNLTVKQNSLVFVVIDGWTPGQAEEAGPSHDESNNDYDEDEDSDVPRECRGTQGATAENDTAVIDLLPAGFVIVSRDIYQKTTALREVASPLVLPCGIGQIRQAEARADSFIGVVRANSRGRFRIGYAVRAQTAGSFVFPPLRVESLAQAGAFEQSARPPRVLIEPE
jgi:uncharacterized protein YfaS (alpha-2-macroglobulin family)